MEQKASIVLLLGSYDSKTIRVLRMMKEEISKLSYYGEAIVLSLLLDDVEIYHANGDSILTESFDEKTTIMVFEEDLLLKEVMDLEVKSKEDLVDVLRDMGYRSILVLPVLEKLAILAAAASLVFVVRDVELTRGGEY